MRIEGGRIELDLPGTADVTETVDYLGRIARGDGIEAIDAGGTVSYTEHAMRAVANVDPGPGRAVASG